MHSTQGPCVICGVTTEVVCVQCGLGLQFCRACLEAMLRFLPSRPLDVSLTPPEEPTP